MFALLTGYDPADFVQIEDLEHIRFEYPAVCQLNPQISELTEQIIHKALQIDPNLRYQTAEELRAALEQVFSEGKAPLSAMVRYVLDCPVAVEEGRAITSSKRSRGF